MEEVLYLIALSISILYVFIVIILFVGYLMALQKKSTTVGQPLKFSVIIPFRNESSNLKRLLTDLSNQNYNRKLKEIICVDDHSSDDSVQTIQKFAHLPIRIMSLKENEKGKKDALMMAYAATKSKYIIQLDADIRIDNHWFKTVNEQLDDSTDLLIPPVLFTPRAFWQKLYCLEFMSIHTITFSMLAFNNPIMANGAHLIYKTDLTDKIGNQQEWKKTVSGDDMAILHKAVQEKADIRFSLNPHLTAYSSAPGSFKNFIRQRTRWIGKVGTHYSKMAIAMALVIILMNLYILFLSLICPFFNASLPALAIVFGTKFMIDAMFLLPGIIHFRKFNWIILYPLLAILYPFYVLLILLNSFSGKSEWKGRSIKIR